MIVDGYIVRWEPVNTEAPIPPMGDQLITHIENYKNTQHKMVSCSAWNLLYETLVKNGLCVDYVAFSESGKPYFMDNEIF